MLLNKTYDQIEREKVEKEKQMKNNLQDIIKKYNIKVEDQMDMANSKRH